MSKAKKGTDERRLSCDRLLVGYDTAALETGLQRMYALEAAYREDLGYVPSWIVSTRLLIEELLGKNDVYHEDIGR